MRLPKMLRTSIITGIGAMASMAGASDPGSFIARVEQNQGIKLPGASETAPVSYAAPQGIYGEPESFIARVGRSQGVMPTGAESTAVSNVAARGSYGEPASFIARVERTQGVSVIPALEREDQLSPEQIRLVQRALTDKGHPTPVSGKLDERTRSSLVAFQRSQSLPITGTLDPKTVDALGFSPTQVTPVRGPSGER